MTGTNLIFFFGSIFQNGWLNTENILMTTSIYNGSFLNGKQTTEQMFQTLTHQQQQAKSKTIIHKSNNNNKKPEEK